MSEEFLLGLVTGGCLITGFFNLVYAGAVIAEQVDKEQKRRLIKHYLDGKWEVIKVGEMKPPKEQDTEEEEESVLVSKNKHDTN